jgi:hypothetical protein
MPRLFGFNTPHAWKAYLFGVLLLANFVAVLAIVRFGPNQTPKAASRPEHQDPLEPRKELVTTLDNETLEESINLLPSFDDTVWVLGSMGDTLRAHDSYSHTRLYVPRLNRGRKIIQQGPDNIQLVASSLNKKLVESADGFGSIYLDMKKAVATSRTGLTLDAPNEYHKRLIYSSSACYILSELEIYGSLREMSAVCKSKDRLPVSRVFLFYSMHRLAMKHPMKNLDDAARDALSEYRQTARDIPDPIMANVPAYNSAFEETDYRILILRKDVGLRNQPHIRLSIYPEQLSADELQDRRPSKRVDSCLEKLLRFIAIQYKVR